MNALHASTEVPDTASTGGGDRPRHVAIIMDGNGRWAKQRGLPREMGHEKGVEALRRTVEAAGELGIEYLSVFSFSTENWQRPEKEISNLFSLLRLYIKRDLKRLVRNGVRIHVCGTDAGVPEDIKTLIRDAETQTQDNTKHNLVIAFNYGSRLEITSATREIARAVANGSINPEDITEESISSRLWTQGIPDPDLLIRTSGEHRLSNFFLWQCAYSELVFSDVYWPDFDHAHLEDAIAEYNSRNRRFGKVDAG